MTFRVAVAFFLVWLFVVETTGAAAALAQESLPPLPSPEDGTPRSERVVPAVPARPAAPATFPVHVAANVTGVQFLMRSARVEIASSAFGEADIRPYTMGCLAPCDLQVAPGEYVVAVSRNGGRAIANREPIAVQGPTNLVAAYESRSGSRVAGVVLTSVFVPIGTVLMVAGLSTSGNATCTTTSGGGQSCSPSSTDPKAVAAGAVIAGLALVIGIPLMLRSDRGSVEVVAEPAAPLETPGQKAPQRDPTAGSFGLGLRVSF